MGRKLGVTRYKILKRVSTDELPLMAGENALERAIRTFYVRRQQMMTDEEKCECPPKVKLSGKPSMRSSALPGFANTTSITLARFRRV